MKLEEKLASISKGKLKPNMLRIFREIESSGEELIVTDRNRPVLRIQPITRKRIVEEMFGGVSGKAVYREDINIPKYTNGG